jgi:predicted component of type VI protein secretion system
MNMKKVLAVTFFFLMLCGQSVQAAEPQTLSVDLLSPNEMNSAPGIHVNVKAKVTNQTDQTIQDVMAYITLGNLSKHMTVNLEDFSADQAVVIGTLKANESKTIELPIQFVYVSEYYLYVTAMSSELPVISSSQAVPVHIVSNSHINPTAINTVMIGMPALLLLIICGIVVRRYQRRKVI